MITVSFSELDTYRQCPLKWRLGYAERWRSQSSGFSALDKGSAYHLIMEVHFLDLQRTYVPEMAGDERYNEDRKISAVCAVQERLDDMREGNEYPEETIQLVEWMYTGYVEQYGIDADWRIMAVESVHIVPFFEEIGGPGKSGEWQEAPDFNLKVKLDLMVTDSRDRLWIVDQKSASTIPRSEKDFQYADQFTLYEFAIRYLGYRVTGTIHNANCSKPNKGDLLTPDHPDWKSTMKASPLEKRMHRTLMSHTDTELRTAQYEALLTARKAYADSYTERNPDEERCKWKCGFNDACNAGRRNGDDGMRDYLIDIGFTQDHGRH